jgi:hypothetical protein
MEAVCSPEKLVHFTRLNRVTSQEATLFSNMSGSNVKKEPPYCGLHNFIQYTRQNAESST